MTLPVGDERELARWAEFAIVRWTLDHNVQLSCIQAMCLGIPMQKEDFMKIVRAYIDNRTENKHPTPGVAFWKNGDEND
jgi:hypothetical protein